MPVAAVVALDHVARETSDLSRFANFYRELLGFEETAAFEIRNMKVKWLSLPGVLTIHVFEGATKSPQSKEPFTPPPDIVELEDLPSADHFCFTLSNFDAFEQTLKDKGIKTFLNGKAQGSEKVKRTFFFDPDGNLLKFQNMMHQQFDSDSTPPPGFLIPFS